LKVERKAKNYAEVTESTEFAGEEKKTQEEERFIAQKACDVKPSFAAQTPFGMTGLDGEEEEV